MEELKNILNRYSTEHYYDCCYNDLNIDGPIIIYGAGYCGAMVCELMQDNGMAPVCFFDKNKLKHGTVIMGVPVQQSETFENAHKYLVVVCMLQKGSLYDEIKNYILGLGYLKVIHITDLRNNKKLFSTQKLIISPDAQFIKDNTDNIEKVHESLSDNDSKETYLKIMEYLGDNINIAIPALPLQQQYFAYDTYCKSDNEVFIDCGAFKGDVMDTFLRNNDFCFSNYFAIEPDPEYIKVLEQKKSKYNMDRISIVHCALSNSTGIVGIQNYGNENSVICSDGGTEVYCNTLDGLLSNIWPTFIKIDVEGFEQRVLAGADFKIRNCKPVLAVAIYHTEKDFWEIPLLIKEKYPFYSLYVRSYMNINETILYAVPENRTVQYQK